MQFAAGAAAGGVGSITATAAAMYAPWLAGRQVWQQDVTLLLQLAITQTLHSSCTVVATAWCVDNAAFACAGAAA
jgi:hypothetical protein